MKTKILNFFRKIIFFLKIDFIIAFFSRRRIFPSWLEKIAPNNYQYPKESIKYIHRDGIFYEVDLSDMLDWKLYFSARNRKRECLFNLTKVGQVVYDIGSHKGAILLQLAKLIGSKGFVYGFEAYPSNAIAAKKNISLNPNLKAKLFAVVLASSSSEVKMIEAVENNTGSNRISADSPSNSTVLPTKSLDQLVVDEKIPDPQLIKITVNGYEWHVLNGAKKILQRSKPILFLELGDHNLKEHGHSSRDLLQLLESLGYEIFTALDKKKITSKIDFSHLVFDIICYPLSS